MSNTEKNAIFKKLLKKKTIYIIGGKCFLAPRLTLESFLVLGLPPQSKKKPRVSLCARKLIFLPMIVIAIIFQTFNLKLILTHIWQCMTMQCFAKYIQICSIYVFYYYMFLIIWGVILVSYIIKKAAGLKPAMMLRLGPSLIWSNFRWL